MATKEQILAAIQKAEAAGDKEAIDDLKSRLSEPEAEPMQGSGTMSFYRGASKLESAKKGLQDSAIRAYIGLKQANDMMPQRVLMRALGLIGAPDTKEDQGVLREQVADASEDPNPGWRTGGNVAGNVALTAIPGARAGALVNAATRSPIVAGAVTSGALGGLLNPGVGDTQEEQLSDKATQSGKDAAFGGAVGAVGKLLHKTLSGLITPSVEARRLMAEDVVPTVSQGAESKLGRFLGGLTSGIYDVSKRQNKEVMSAFLKRVSPQLDTSGMTVQEINQHLSQYFRGSPQAIGEYEKLLGGKSYQMTPTARTSLWRTAAGNRGMQSEARNMSLRAMGGTGDAMLANNNVRMNFGKMMEYRQKIQDAISEFTANNVNEKQAKVAMIRVKNDYDTLVRDPQLSPQERALLEDLNQRYTDFLRFKDASASASFQRKPNVNDLQKSYASDDPEGFALGNTTRTQQELLDPAARVMGLVPRQDEARSLVSAVKRASIPIAKATAGAAATGFAPLVAAPVYGLSALSQTRAGARALMGDYEAQRKLARLLEQYLPNTAAAGFQASDGDQ